MAIFDFECTDCGTKFEVFQKSDDPNPPCKNCGSVNTVKQISNGTTFILKGRGWPGRSGS